MVHVYILIQIHTSSQDCSSEFQTPIPNCLLDISNEYVKLNIQIGPLMASPKPAPPAIFSTTVNVSPFILSVAQGNNFDVISDSTFFHSHIWSIRKSKSSSIFKISQEFNPVVTSPTAITLL